MTSPAWKHTMSFGALALLAALALGSGGKKQDTSSTSSSATPTTGNATTPAPASSPAAPDKPTPAFVTDRAAACDKYKAESNEIKASKVFSDYIAKSDAAGYKVDDWSGTIDKIETSHGGGEVMLKIKTDHGTFDSNDILQGNKRSLPKGGKVYNALAEMSVGDDVIFSAKLVAPYKGFTERGAICGDDWVALFTSVKKK